LFPDKIIFKGYYFPVWKEKIVGFEDVEKITVKPPTI